MSPVSTENKLITQRVITEDYAFENLTRIFPSSVILKSDFTIVAVSDEIEKSFKYNNDDLLGNPVSVLMKTEFPRFRKYIYELVRKGFFMSKPFYILDKSGMERHIRISGFYMGLISDLNDILVIVIDDLSPIKKYKKQIKQRESEFNELIYRTHHEIKGPIATIKGLLNIVKLENNGNNINGLYEMINQSISLLDKRITNIAQFHELNTMVHESGELLDLKKIEREAQRMISNHCILKDCDLEIVATDIISLQISCELIGRLVSLIIKAISSLDETGEPKKISLHFSKYNTNLKIKTGVRGFSCGADLKERLMTNKYSIEYAIKDDSVLRFYIVFNYILNQDGRISYEFLPDGQIISEIIIPF